MLYHGHVHDNDNEIEEEEPIMLAGGWQNV
jgi:hypothetical protein